MRRPAAVLGALSMEGVAIARNIVSAGARLETRERDARVEVSTGVDDEDHLTAAASEHDDLRHGKRVSVRDGQQRLFNL